MSPEKLHIRLVGKKCQPLKKGNIKYGVKMNAEPLTLACQLVDLDQLNNRPFNKYPRGFIEVLLQNVPSYVTSTFLYLLDQSLKNYKKKGVVVLSAHEIAIAVCKSPRTVERHLALLRKVGYIRVLKSLKGYYRRNYIEVVCPKSVLEHLLNTQRPIRNTVDQNNTVYLCPTQMTEYPDTSVVHNNRYIDKSIIKNNIRETNPLDNFKITIEDIKPAKTISNVSCETSDVEAPLEVLPINEPITLTTPIEPSVEPKAEVARFISKQERIEVTKKIRAMKKAGEIHPKVQVNYQDIVVLIQEVIVHCMYRNVLRCKTFKHSLNFAAKAIRKGTWSTPRRITQAEISRREQQVREAKERELREGLGSLGQILKEAVQAKNGLSDANIARGKATILEQGIRELGTHATSDRIKALKEAICRKYDARL